MLETGHEPGENMKTMNYLLGREKFGHLPRAISEGGKLVVDSINSSVRETRRKPTVIRNGLRLDFLRRFRARRIVVQKAQSHLSSPHRACMLLARKS